MSWRAESTFKKAGALNEDEKEFMKAVKKLRDIAKLEERLAKGDKLETLQLQKVEAKGAAIKDLTDLAAKLPQETECLEKNQDVVALLPSAIQDSICKKRVAAAAKAEQDQRRREQRDEREKEERKRPEHMCRHDRPITGICCSADSRFIYTCSKDKFVICWSTREKLLKSVRTFAGHTGAVWAVDLAPAGPERLLTGGADGKICCWSAEPPAPRAAPSVLTTPEVTIDYGGIVRVLKWCPFDETRFAVACEKLGSQPAAVSVFKAAGRGFEQVVRIEKDLPGKANDIVWGSGGKTKLFTCHDNGYLGVWSVDDDGKLLKTVKLHKAPISSLSLAVDGSYLLTASHDKTASVVDVTKPSMDVLQTFTANRPLNAVGCTNDFKALEAGALVVGGGRDTREVTTSKLMEDEFEAKLFDATDPQEPYTAGTGHFGPIHKLLFLSGQSDVFATVSEDGCLRVHKVDGTLVHSDTLQ